MAKAVIPNYNAEQIYPEDFSIDEALSDNSEEFLVSSTAKDPRLQIIALYNRIQMLKDVSSKLLTELKQCRKSFDDASTVVGELNANFKKS